jgi:hypothetical protein
MEEIFTAFTGESLGFVHRLDPETVAEFLKLPSQWHVKLCDVRKVVFVDSELAEALCVAHEDGRVVVGFESDRQVMLASVVRDGLALRFASAELRADREVVLASVVQDGLALRYASAELRADREVVFVAVSQNGAVLHFASAELRADREVVFVAVSQNGAALQFASAEIWAELCACRGVLEI